MSTRLIIGINSVSQAIARGQVISLLRITDAKPSQRLQSLIEQAKSANIRIVFGPKYEIDMLAPGTKHQGVVAELQIDSAEVTLLDLAQREEVLFLMLDGVQDPHNLGACLRSAAAAGVDAVIIPKDRAVGITPTVTKVAAGGADIVPVFVETNLSRTLSQLQTHDVFAVAMTGYTPTSIYDVDFKKKLVLIMGAEDKGVSQKLMEHADVCAKIPMLGDIESLNVSVATGVTLFEAVRQRTQTH